ILPLLHRIPKPVPILERGVDFHELITGSGSLQLGEDSTLLGVDVDGVTTLESFPLTVALSGNLRHLVSLFHLDLIVRDAELPALAIDHDVNPGPRVVSVDKSLA